MAGPVKEAQVAIHLSRQISRNAQALDIRQRSAERERRSRQSDNAAIRQPLMRANYTDQRRRMPIDHWPLPPRINIDTSPSRWRQLSACPSWTFLDVIDILIRPEDGLRRGN